MARQSSVRTLVTFGVKYAPLAYEGLRRGRGPATAFAERQVSRRAARGIAMEHAAHLVDGSVLPVYDGDLRVWVVFSGDRPVGTHPVVTTPVEDLLAHYDLAKRLRPAHVRRRRLPVPRRAGRAPGPEQVAISDQPDA
ncbi:hypothetical protein [Mobilicoccus sp.]|uniref:hypothetical protein n=1 Tax=Mobilicoccus sp. TaxID=2034349 RepID=UPI00289D7649|nr:hypothetical protein [Mobilicoccus sp.]